MKEAFETKKFRASSLATIERANAICEDYAAQGYNLTLRQIYYQFVARGWLPNSQRNYKNLGGIINDARLAGLMDWSYVQDRTRNVHGGFFGYNDPGKFMERQAENYFEAIWEGQFYRPEVWVEKDALVDVVGQACAQTRTPYFSCRGYVSQSEMYDAAQRMQRRWENGCAPVVIHLGDHDPSGIDMSRDIEDRLSLMARTPIDVRRIALNMDQIRAYDPPPNPAKLTDSRGWAYVEEYGDESWELDALEPRVLTELIQTTLEGLIDRDLMNTKIAHENEATDRLVEVAQRWEAIDDNWPAIEELIDN